MKVEQRPTGGCSAANRAPCGESASPALKGAINCWSSTAEQALVGHYLALEINASPALNSSVSPLLIGRQYSVSTPWKPHLQQSSCFHTRLSFEHSYTRSRNTGSATRVIEAELCAHVANVRLMNIPMRRVQKRSTNSNEIENWVLPFARVYEIRSHSVFKHQFDFLVNIRTHKESTGHGNGLSALQFTFWDEMYAKHLFQFTSPIKKSWFEKSRLQRFPRPLLHLKTVL